MRKVPRDVSRTLMVNTRISNTTLLPMESIELGQNCGVVSSMEGLRNDSVGTVHFGAHAVHEGVRRLHNSELSFTLNFAAWKFAQHAWSHRYCISDVCLVDMRIRCPHVSGEGVNWPSNCVY
jgi:hypothetical protein